MLQKSTVTANTAATSLVGMLNNGFSFFHRMKESLFRRRLYPHKAFLIRSFPGSKTTGIFRYSLSELTELEIARPADKAYHSILRSALAGKSEALNYIKNWRWLGLMEKSPEWILYSVYSFRNNIDIFKKSVADNGEVKFYTNPLTTLARVHLELTSFLDSRIGKIAMQELESDNGFASHVNPSQRRSVYRKCITMMADFCCKAFFVEDFLNFSRIYLNEESRARILLGSIYDEKSDKKQSFESFVDKNPILLGLSDIRTRLDELIEAGAHISLQEQHQIFEAYVASEGNLRFLSYTFGLNFSPIQRKEKAIPNNEPEPIENGSSEPILSANEQQLLDLIKSLTLKVNAPEYQRKQIVRKAFKLAQQSYINDDDVISILKIHNSFDAIRKALDELHIGCFYKHPRRGETANNPPIASFPETTIYPKVITPIVIPKLKIIGKSNSDGTVKADFCDWLAKLEQENPELNSKIVKKLEILRLARFADLIAGGGVKVIKAAHPEKNGSLLYELKVSQARIFFVRSDDDFIILGGMIKKSESEQTREALKATARFNRINQDDEIILLAE